MRHAQTHVVLDSDGYELPVRSLAPRLPALTRRAVGDICWQYRRRVLAIVGIAYWDAHVACQRLPRRGEKLRVVPVFSGPGGDAANTASHLAELGCPVTLCCRLAADDAGESFRAACRARPNLQLLAQPVSHTTQATLLGLPSGERTILYVEPEEGMKPLADEASLAVVEQAWGAWVDVADSDSRVAFANAAHRCGFPALHLDEVGAAGCRANWAVGSLDESPLPAEALMLKVGLDACVMTEGARRQHLWRPQCGWEHLPALVVPAILDSTGAGDSFLAGLLAGLRRGLSATDACALGSQTAARCVQTLGA